MVVIRPCGFFGSGSSGSSHGSPYAHATNVPLILMSQRWFMSTYYGQYTETVDIAPTLAALLRILPPGGSEGRVLRVTSPSQLAPSIQRKE